MDSFWTELIKLGVAGLVIYVVAAPLIKFLIDRSKVQDERMQRLVDDHLQHDNEKHQRVISLLDKIDQRIALMPTVTAAEVGKLFPPKTIVNVQAPPANGVPKV